MTNLVENAVARDRITDDNHNARSDHGVPMP